MIYSNEVDWRDEYSYANYSYIPNPKPIVSYGEFVPSASISPILYIHA